MNRVSHQVVGFILETTHYITVFVIYFQDMNSMLYLGLLSSKLFCGQFNFANFAEGPNSQN